MLMQNGYKEGVDGLQHVIESEYNTYEDGQRMMSHIAHRVTPNTVASVFPCYVRAIPTGCSIMHYNGTLRDKLGLHVTDTQLVPESLRIEMRELYDTSCAFDILYNERTKSYTVIDFAYEAEYSQRRNLYYNFDLMSHIDKLVRSQEELDAYVASLSTNVSSAQIDVQSLMIKRANCMYNWDAAMSNAYMMSMYSVDSVTSVNMTSDTTIEVVSETVATKAETDELRTICVTRGILV
jgi:hypothetical protein